MYDYDSSWISLLGLGLEMLGLGLLSYDLLRSKSADDESAEFRALQDQLEASTRELIFNLGQHVDLVSDFFGQLLVVIARESEYEEILRANPNLATDEPGKAALIRHALDKGPDGLRRQSAERFLDASNRLKSGEQIQRALALNADTTKKITERFNSALRLSIRLRRIATFGVMLAAAGATAQLVDLIW